MYVYTYIHINNGSIVLEPWSENVSIPGAAGATVNVELKQVGLFARGFHYEVA